MKGGCKWVSKKKTWKEGTDGRTNPNNEHNDAEKQMPNCRGEGTGHWKTCVTQEQGDREHNKSCSGQNMCNGLNGLCLLYTSDAADES